MTKFRAALCLLGLALSGAAVDTLPRPFPRGIVTDPVANEGNSFRIPAPLPHSVTRIELSTAEWM
jgi:hypothetical protein